MKHLAGLKPSSWRSELLRVGVRLRRLQRHELATMDFVPKPIDPSRPDEVYV